MKISILLTNFFISPEKWSVKKHVVNLFIKLQYFMNYRISLPISPGLIRVRKTFLMGLSAGGLIRGGGLYVGQKMANEIADTARQNTNLYLKNEEYVSYYSSICSFKKICT